MKTKSIIFSILLFNLITGNFILSIFKAKYETIAGQILFHFTFSIVAVLLILLLIRFFQKRHNRLIVILFSTIASFLVPTISMYILCAGYGLFQFEYDSVIKGVPIAIISGIVSWFLWLPIGLINSAFFIAYTNKLREDEK